MKRALIYDPYLDTMGGGERYVLSFASVLVKNGYTVDLAWKSSDIFSEAEKRFNLDLSGILVNTKAYQSLSLSSGLIKRYQCTREYDLTFWVSDGSLPFLFGKKNYIHFQVPFTKIGGNNVTNLLKISRVSKFIYNSDFTKSFVSPQLPLSSGVVLYPPIDVEAFVPGKKEKLILSVARFDSPSHAKRQDVLVDAFRLLNNKNKDYKLVLAGGLKGDSDSLNYLKNKIGNLPIEVIPNPKFDELRTLYGKASIFWHAAGFGVDEKQNPEKVEHFGMTTVEAMASGAVPVVINRGGQREILNDDTGYLCDSVEELVFSTLLLIESPEKLKYLSDNAQKRAKKFGLERFTREISQIVAS